MHKQAIFYRNETDMEMMASYIAQLEREGVQYRIDRSIDEFKVEVVGH